jgi:hypothetical protein
MGEDLDDGRMDRLPGDFYGHMAEGGEGGHEGVVLPDQRPVELPRHIVVHDRGLYPRGHL